MRTLLLSSAFLLSLAVTGVAEDKPLAGAARVTPEGVRLPPQYSVAVFSMW